MCYQPRHGVTETFGRAVRADSPGERALRRYRDAKKALALLRNKLKLTSLAPIQGEQGEAGLGKPAFQRPLALQRGDAVEALPPEHPFTCPMGRHGSPLKHTKPAGGTGGHGSGRPSRARGTTVLGRERGTASGGPSPRRARARSPAPRRRRTSPASGLRGRACPGQGPQPAALAASLPSATGWLEIRPALTAMAAPPAALPAPAGGMRGPVSPSGALPWIPRRARPERGQGGRPPRLPGGERASPRRPAPHCPSQASLLQPGLAELPAGSEIWGACAPPPSGRCGLLTAVGGRGRSPRAGPHASVGCACMAARERQQVDPWAWPCSPSSCHPLPAPAPVSAPQPAPAPLLLLRPPQRSWPAHSTLSALASYQTHTIFPVVWWSPSLGG